MKGTQSSLVDLLLFENQIPTAVSKQDVEEVSNYVRITDVTVTGDSLAQSGCDAAESSCTQLKQIAIRGGYLRKNPLDGPNSPSCHDLRNLCLFCVYAKL